MLEQFDPQEVVGYQVLAEEHRIYPEALALIADWTAKGEAKSVGLLGNAAEVFPELLKRMQAGGPRPDIVTDQTSAHDPLFYLPAGTAYDDWERERTEDPRGFTKRSQESMATHVRAMVELAGNGGDDSETAPLLHPSILQVARLPIQRFEEEEVWHAFV